MYFDKKFGFVYARKIKCYTFSAKNRLFDTFSFNYTYNIYENVIHYNALFLSIYSAWRADRELKIVNGLNIAQCLTVRWCCYKMVRKKFISLTFVRFFYCLVQSPLITIYCFNTISEIY